MPEPQSRENDHMHPREQAQPDSSILLGTVPYLNVQPNIWALQRGLVKWESGPIKIVPDVPRQLARRLAAGEFDSAIVPVFEYFRRPGTYHYIPGPVIAAHGPVASVLLFSSVPLEHLKLVYLDTSSLTSVNLFRVLAAEKGLHIELRDATTQTIPTPLPQGTGWVLIGDPALAQAGQHPHTLDLAHAWQQLTGMPFVFAAWLCHRNLRKPGITALLQHSLEIGLANLQTVAKDSAGPFNVSAEFALRYFQENIHYHLGEKELAGWTEFGRLCYKHHLIPEQPKLQPHTD